MTLRVGDGAEWAQATDIAPNGGSEDTVWKFEPEEMCGEVMASYLAKNKINFTVKDSNECSADKYVGKTQLCMDELLSESNSNKFVTLSGQLHSHDDCEYSAGEYTVKLKFVVPVTANNNGGESEMGATFHFEEESGEEVNA